jgi:osmoprotectant transport system ATP-binding protein
MAEGAVAFHNVTKWYTSQDAPAVRDLNLIAHSGELLVLIGQSGSGKTTSLNMVNRLVEPSSGTISVDGIDVKERGIINLRRKIGYVFQGIGLFPHMSVQDNIGITPRLLGWPREDIAARIDELLALVRLDSGQYRNRFPADLSGGQRQRIGLARALAARPRIMLMDEPFGALDPVTRDDLSADYRQIHRELGLTTLLVTHDMTEAFLLADRIAIMRHGALVQAGTPAEIVAAPADDFVRTLIETPKRRAEQLTTLIGKGEQG